MATAAKDKRTGPGQHKQLPDGATLLFNFDIDSAILKTEHIAFLSQNILTRAAANPDGLRVVIGGTADRLGVGLAAHNLALSNRRIDAVIAFLKSRMPRYPWDFVGFGKGVGEETAKKAGDEENQRNDEFRAVIIEVLKPGQPIPPKPRIPNSTPKKNNPFPKPDRPAACLPDAQIPPADLFEVRLVGGGTIGEGVEFGFFSFLIRDKVNGLTCNYHLRSAGTGIGSPINVSINGEFKEFRTSTKVRVTRFGPIASFVGGTPLFAGPVSIGLLSVSFRPDGSILPRLKPFISVDTGNITVPGAGVQGGSFSQRTLCGLGSGASRFQE